MSFQFHAPQARLTTLTAVVPGITALVAVPEAYGRGDISIAVDCEGVFKKRTDGRVEAAPCITVTLHEEMATSSSQQPDRRWMLVVRIVFQHNAQHLHGLAARECGVGGMSNRKHTILIRTQVSHDDLDPDRVGVVCAAVGEYLLSCAGDAEHHCCDRYK
ncbi:MAG TPA: hypothetical protein DIT01_09265 [Lentisphaeria bacterium]|nr:hypothetical protein [Lentisphaeria bacterium]